MSSARRRLGLAAAIVVPTLASYAWAAHAAPKPPKKKGPPAASSSASTSAAPSASAAAPASASAAPKPIDNGGDVVEKIDLGDKPPAPITSTSASASIEPPKPAAPVDEFTMRGWARTRLSAAIAGDAASAADPAAVRVPFDKDIAEQLLMARARYVRGKTFEVVVSGLIGYRIASHTSFDPTAGTTPTAARGSYEAQLREAYVGFFWPSFDLRIGQQRIAWGNSDAFTPNDVLNPRDLRDPILTETDVLRIPTLAVRGDIALGFGELELVGQPFFVPDRVDAYGTNWAYIQPGAPAPLRGLFNRLSSLVDPSLLAAYQPILRQTALPADDFSGASGAAKFSTSAGPVDFGAYYHYGYTYSPALTIAPALQNTITTTNWTTATLAQVTPILGAVGTPALQSTYQRRHHVGASTSIVSRPFVVRADAAYDTALVFSDRNLLSVVRPAAQGVLGVEYQSGELGKTIILEGWYQRLMGDPLPGPLLGAEVENVSVASVIRWTFLEHLEIEMRGVAGIKPLGATLRPQIAYKTDDGFELRIGVVWIDGEDGSAQHYFRRNTSAYTMAKYSF